MKLPTRAVAAAAASIVLAAGGYFAYERWAGVQRLPEGLIQANGRIEGDAVTEGQVAVELDDRAVQARVAQDRQAVAALTAQVSAARRSLSVLRRSVPLEIDRAEAAVLSARAVVAKAASAEVHERRSAERYRELAGQGIVDQHAVEQAELAWQVVRSDLSAAQSALVQARRQLAEARLGWDRIRAQEDQVSALEAQLGQAQAAVTEAESVLSDLTILAPTSGVVTTRAVDVGEVVAAGSPLLDLVDLDRLYLKVYVPEAQIGKVRLGLPARIYADAFPDQPFPATVRYIASQAEFTPKDENPHHRLTPGLPADAVIRWQEGAPWARPRW